MTRMTPMTIRRLIRSSESDARALAFAPGRAGRLLAIASVALGCTGEISPDPSQEALAGGDTPARRTPSTQPSELAQTVAEDSLAADPLRGGRLYDRFYSENASLNFTPDAPETALIADGEGGPLGNGTLRNGAGLALDNALDHGYRLKSFFGWDMRGADGIYGPAYQDKAYVAPYNLIEDALSREQVAGLLVDGARDVPAYGEVMPPQDLSDVVAFVMAVREHELPQPGDIWELNADAPKGYVLKSGARVEAGRAAISASCSGCHGADGTRLLFDEGELSLGSLARGGAYEVWFKIVAGNPGTPMGSQVPSSEPWAEQSQMVLDVIAALCDRARYPLGDATAADVEPADARCGEYLR
jgi:cytochrome c553